jgi:hypothetical protein
VVSRDSITQHKEQTMRTLLRRWFGRRTPVARPARELLRRRPEFDILEDRVVPSITLPTAGTPGPATLTGTGASGQFLVRLQANTPTNVQFSDDGGKTFQTAALSDVTQIIVNGVGRDTLTLDLSNGLIGNTASGGLPIQFNGGPGLDVLNLVGNPGGTITETFTLGTNTATDTLAVGNGTKSFTVSLASSAAVVDSLTATNFVFNGNDNNNLITLASRTQGSTTALLIAGFNSEALSVPGGPDSDQGSSSGNLNAAKDDNGNGDDNGQGNNNGNKNGNNGNGNGNNNDNNSGHKSADKDLDFLEDQDETTDNAFAGLTLTNKTNVTVNGLGGDDLFVANITSVPTGLTTLTLDGGTGTNVLVGRALPTTGVTVTVLNFQRQDTDDNDIFIDDMFAERLERTPDTAAMTFFRGVLNSGGQAAVVQDIEQSEEAEIDLIRNDFLHLLGRDVDNAGAAFFLSLFQQGATEEQVEATILGSQEFMAHAQSLIGATNQNENFIRGAFTLLLGHDASASALSAWENFLQSGNTTTAALLMTESTEFRTQALNGFFATLLGRPLDAAGSNFFLNVPGMSLSQMRMAIEDSAEFLSRGRH